MNVVNLGEFKEQKEIRKSEEAYKGYLKTLGNSQLEIEVNSLLEEFSGQVYGREFFSKGQLILKEISSRTHEKVRKKIELFTNETLHPIP